MKLGSDSDEIIFRIRVDWDMQKKSSHGSVSQLLKLRAEHALHLKIVHGALED